MRLCESFELLGLGLGLGLGLELELESLTGIGTGTGIANGTGIVTGIVNNSKSAPTDRVLVLAVADRALIPCSTTYLSNLSSYILSVRVGLEVEISR